MPIWNLILRHHINNIHTFKTIMNCGKFQLRRIHWLLAIAFCRKRFCTDCTPVYIPIAHCFTINFQFC